MPSSAFTYVQRFAAGAAMVGVAWYFNTHWLVPLRLREAESRQKLADARQRISDSKGKIREIGVEEHAARAARASLDSLQRDIPKDPTPVWLPVRLKKHLRSAGIAEAGIRMNVAIPEPGIPGYERSYWHLNLPRQEGMRTMSGLLLAVAEIERQEPFVRILDVSFSSDSDEPHWPAGGFNVTALVPQ